MPLPLLIVGALVASAVGVAKGVGAKKDFDEAEETNEDAKRIYERAEESLKECRQKTQDELEALGAEKVSLFEHAIGPFVDTYRRIKNVNFQQKDFPDDAIGDIAAEVLRVEESASQMAEVVNAGPAALSSGALAGLAAYGGVGLVGTASTGTAIASLSGAAATNATLAWLGGGSLAAGGMGMAGGMAVLGGIVAAPVLLVGGFVLASRAEEALENAKSNLLKANGCAEAMKTAEKATKAIARKSAEVRRVMKEIHDYLISDTQRLRDLVDSTDEKRDGGLVSRTLLRLRPVRRRNDYSRYNERERKLVYRTVNLAKTASNLALVPLLDEDGVITAEIRNSLKNSKQYIKKLADM